MGQRAHGRRHEGRAIRKARREQREPWAELTVIGEQFAEVGRLLTEVFGAFIETLRNTFAGLSDVMFDFSFGRDVVIVPESSPRRMLIAGNDPVITPSQRTTFENFIGHQVIDVPPLGYTWEQQRALWQEYRDAKKPAPSED